MNKCTYRWDKKAWITSSLFEDYLNDLNHKMIKSNRSIVLLLDNATPHVDLPLSNVKLVFYPPNCTSHIQPLDQGIIRSFKAYYKHNLVNRIIHEIDNPDSKKMNILDSSHRGIK